MKAVILAGGLGIRLRPYTEFMPKPMLPIAGKPILEHIIEWIRKNRIRSVILCISYMGDVIKRYFGDGTKFGVNIEYAISDRQLATAGQLKTAQEFIDDRFACIYSDAIYRFGLQSMIQAHKKSKNSITVALYRYKTNLQYGVIRTTSTGRITRWDEKPEITKNINVGCYIMEQEVLDMIPTSKSYGMDQLIKKLIVKRRVGSFVSSREFTDIGDVAAYNKASQEHWRVTEM